MGWRIWTGGDGGGSPWAHRMSWLDLVVHCKVMKASDRSWRRWRRRLRLCVKGSAPALEFGWRLVTEVARRRCSHWEALLESIERHFQLHWWGSSRWRWWWHATLNLVQVSSVVMAKGGPERIAHDHQWWHCSDAATSVVSLAVPCQGTFRPHLRTLKSQPWICWQLWRRSLVTWRLVVAADWADGFEDTSQSSQVCQLFLILNVAPAVDEQKMKCKLIFFLSFAGYKDPIQSVNINPDDGSF